MIYLAITPELAQRDANGGGGIGVAGRGLLRARGNSRLRCSGAEAAVDGQARAGDERRFRTGDLGDHSGDLCRLAVAWQCHLGVHGGAAMQEKNFDPLGSAMRRPLSPESRS